MRENYININLKHWGEKDLLTFNVEFFGGVENIEMEFVIGEDEYPYLRPYNIKEYDSLTDNLEELYSKKNLEVKNTIKKWFKGYEIKTIKEFTNFSNEESAKLFPIRMYKKEEENEKVIEFIFNKMNNLVGTEFELIYYPEKKKIVDSSLENYISKKSFCIKIHNTYTNIINSNFLHLLTKNSLETQVEGWIKKELEINLGSLYK